MFPLILLITLVVSVLLFDAGVKLLKRRLKENRAARLRAKKAARTRAANQRIKDRAKRKAQRKITRKEQHNRFVCLFAPWLARKLKITVANPIKTNQHNIHKPVVPAEVIILKNARAYARRRKGYAAQDAVLDEMEDKLPF